MQPNELITKLQKLDIDTINQFDRQQILDILSGLEYSLIDETLHKLHFEDIKMYHTLMDYIPAYNVSFIEDVFIPFLKKNNPNTIKILQISTFFYALVIYDFLIEITTTNPDIKEKLNKEKLGTISLFDYCFSLFAELRNKSDRMFFPYGIPFYVDYNMARLIEKNIIDNYQNSSFKHILDDILGQYRTWFSYSNYITEYQPMFLRVIEHYWVILQNSPY